MPSSRPIGLFAVRGQAFAATAVFFYAVVLCYPVWAIARMFEYWWAPDAVEVFALLDFSDESPEDLTSFQKICGFLLWVVALPLYVAGQLFL